MNLSAAIVTGSYGVEIIVCDWPAEPSPHN
jgi:hypothetical protein